MGLELRALTESLNEPLTRFSPRREKHLQNMIPGQELRGVFADGTEGRQDKGLRTGARRGSQETACSLRTTQREAFGGADPVPHGGLHSAFSIHTDQQEAQPT